MSYQLVKALHIIFMVAWFAGLFYIFRLFVYHVENWDKADAVQVLSTMQRKLLNIIMAPAFVLTWVFGLMMLMMNPALIKMPWMHMKLTLVFLLMAYHAYSYIVYLKFQKRQKVLTSKACRMINEVPTIILILVVILAVVKPGL